MRLLRQLTQEDLGKAIKLKIDSWNEQLAGLIEDQIEFEEAMKYWIQWMNSAKEFSDCRLLIGMFQGDELLGAAFASIAEAEDMPTGGIELNGLWVDSRFRFQGIALQLLKYIIGFYRDYDSHMEKMVVYSHHYAPSNDFYAKLGAKLIRQDRQMEGKLLVDVMLIDFCSIEDQKSHGRPYMIHSPNSSDLSTIENGLSQYNKLYCKQDVYERFNFIAEDEDGVIGGCTGSIGWGWMNINNLFVRESKRHNGLGTRLLDQALKLAVNKKITQISIPTIFDDVETFLVKKGFILDGVLENRPNGYLYRFMSRFIEEMMDFESPNHGIKEVVSEDPLVQSFNNLVENHKVTQLGEIPFEMIYLSVKNKSNDCVGGLVAYIGWEWLYIADLWLNELERGKGYAKELMAYAEAYAKSKGIRGAFLGTTDFQAPNFYKKIGYTIFSIRKDLPPGYNNYSMLKVILKEGFDEQDLENQSHLDS